MNAICIVVDGLHHAYLGCYGNSWVGTSAIDRLAIEGFVFDQAYAETLDPAAAYRALWHGRHPLAQGGAETDLVSAVAVSGVHTCLISDEALLASFPPAEKFAETQLLPTVAPREPASDGNDTQLASLFAAVADWLDNAPPSFLLWVHAAALNKVWDAPMEERGRYADEDEEVEPYRDVAPPRGAVAKDADPDELLAIRWAYAAQVSTLDDCLAALFEQLADSPHAAETLVLLVGSKGYPLGEHLQLGIASPDEAAGQTTTTNSNLFSEALHVPYIVRLPPGRTISGRSQSLVQLADVCPTLLDWFGLPTAAANPTAGQSLIPVVCGESPAVRDRSISVGANKADSPGDEQPVAITWAFRTQAWLLKVSGQEADRRTALFAKPDDRWEINDVADRCADVATDLEAAAVEFINVARGDAPSLSPLDPALLADQG